MFWAYTLYNVQAEKIYISQTDNLQQRLAEHNKKLGNHYTALVPGEWVLVYSESVATRSEVLKQERQLKSSRGREFIKQFIPI